MKRGKIILAAVYLATLLSGGAIAAEEGGWLNDFELAKKRSSEKELPILAFFTGSDWCSWCKKLQSEVMSQKLFKDYAVRNFVLFEADFPRRSELPEAVKIQNSKLIDTYGVRGFPTLLILDSKGKVLGQTGYRAGGAEKYVEHLKAIKP